MPRPGNPLYTPLKGELRREIEVRGEKWIVYLTASIGESPLMGLRRKGASRDDVVWFSMTEWVDEAKKAIAQMKAFSKRGEA